MLPPAVLLLLALTSLSAPAALAEAPTPSSVSASTASVLVAPLPQTVLCHPPLDVRGPDLPDDVVAAFAADAAQLVDTLRPRVGDTDCRPIVITLVSTMASANSLDPPWHLPTWAAGAAQPAERRIVVGVSAEGRVQDRARTLHHELAHVLVRSAAGDAALPRWLDEGLARVLAGEHGIDDLRVLAQARLSGHFLPLAALVEGFPAGAADAQLAYAQSGRAVSLFAEADDDAIARLLAGVRGGLDPDDALRQVGGRATWQLDRDVRHSVTIWAALATVGTQVDFAMGGCAVVVGIFGVRARRRQLARIRAMADDEAQQKRTPAVANVTRWTVAAATC